MSTKQEINIRTAEEYQFGFHDEENYVYKRPKGLSKEVVEEISSMKNEPGWMRDIRLKALDIFYSKPLPSWGGDLSTLDFNNMHYFIRPSEKKQTNWEDVPEYIKDTFEKLGIPEAERKFLAGAGAQYESESVYHNLKKELEELGVIFLDTDSALREYPEIVKKYFGTIVPAGDNKFAALNTAVWSGGSFVYVPKGVRVEQPLQAYFRINAENAGQFERTMIIGEENSYINYVEGCTAPIYATDSLHSAVVEVICHKGSRVRYTTIQNWSSNVYNLVTKRAVAYENATMEWIDGNMGSKLTMKYPSVYLLEPGARADILSLAIAGKNQHQDAGGKVVHGASNTSSRIISKSISKNSGRTSYRGLVKVHKGCKNVKSNIRCDALLLDESAISDTYPYMEIDDPSTRLAHEATVSKLSEEQLFYLMSRGLGENEATAMLVSGFIEPIVKELPMEFAVEMNRLIQVQLEDSVG